MTKLQLTIMVILALSFLVFTFLFNLCILIQYAIRTKQFLIRPFTIPMKSNNTIS